MYLHMELPSKRILSNLDDIAVIRKDVLIFRYVDRRIPCSATIPDEINGKYYIEKILGCGAYGIVYKIHERSTCTQYALKTIEKDPLSSIQEQIWAQREVDITVLMNHPFEGSEIEWPIANELGSEDFSSQDPENQFEPEDLPSSKILLLLQAVMGF